MKDYTGEFHKIAYNICSYFLPNIGEYSESLNAYLHFYSTKPILFLPIGIFVIGAVIGLARRLIRG